MSCTIRCGARSRPKQMDSVDQDGFNNICELLRNDDPSVVRVSTERTSVPFDSLSDIPKNNERFWQALKNNKVVPCIDIDMSDLCTGYPTTAIPSVWRPLEHFIEHNPSLTTVYFYCTTAYEFELSIIRAITSAMLKNSSIQSFCTQSARIPLPILTSFLIANQGLRRLAIQIEEESDEDVDAAARTIASHSTLEDISLAGTTGIATALSPFLLCLHSHGTMTKLTLKWIYYSTPDMSLLPAVLQSSQKLKDVSLCSLTIDGTQFTLIADGLAASPHISHFALENCRLTEDATDLFLTNAPSNAVLQQHIRKLYLSCDLFSKNVLEPSAVLARLVRAINRSLVGHVVLTRDALFSMLSSENTARFFTICSNENAATTTLLHTMELSEMDPTVLEHISVYIAKTTHLRRLKIDIKANGMKERLLAVPKIFLSSLRSNGSLYSVRVRRLFGGTPTKRVRRYIRACTRRNRALPKVLSTLFPMDKSTQSKNRGIAATPPLSQRLPTLCTSAMQAQQMAPNNVLIGLLASLQVVDQKGRDGKRANGG